MSINQTSLEPSKPLLSNTTYNRLKWIAQYFLPALGTLYYVLAEIWGLPRGEEVVGSIVALDTFLGALLGISAHRYNNSDAKFDGVMTVVTREDDADVYSLRVADDIDMSDKNELTIKVQNPA